MSKQEIMNFKPKFYHYVFLFIVGCLLGVVVEGVFAIFDKGVWENHVTFVWGYLNIVYGAGAVMSYVVAKKMAKYNIIITFVVYLILASVLEWLCGFIEEVFLNSTSWDYEALGNLTIAKYISVPFSIAWGILGILFIKFLLPPITKLFMKKTENLYTLLIRNQLMALISYLIEHIQMSICITDIWSGLYYHRNKDIKKAFELSQMLLFLFFSFFFFFNRLYINRHRFNSV